MAHHSLLSNLFNLRPAVTCDNNNHENAFDDGFIIVGADDCLEPPPYNEAIAEPPPPYTAGGDDRFRNYAEAQLPTYGESSAATAATTSGTGEETSKFSTNYALNSVPFDLSPCLRMDSLDVPAPPVISMKNYWYDFSFERTFLRDFETSYRGTMEFDFAFGDSSADDVVAVESLRVFLPTDVSSRHHSHPDEMNLMLLE